MVTAQRDGVQHFHPAKIITGAMVRVSDLSLDDALTELLSVIAAPPQWADAVDMNMTCSMFASFTNANGSTAVKTAAALAVICKRATEPLWPATLAGGAPHGGMRHLEGLILLPAYHGHLRPHSPPNIDLNSLLYHHCRRSENTETARSGSTLATSPPTRTPTARAELGGPC